MRLEFELIAGLVARILREKLWRSRVALLLLCFVCISFLIGAYSEMRSLFAPWTFAALIFTLSVATLWNKPGSILQRLTLVGAGILGSLALWLLVNLTLLIPGPGRALIAWIAPLFLVVSWVFITLVWFANLFFGSLEKEGLQPQILQIKNAPIAFFRHFGCALFPLVLFSLITVWARHINKSAFSEIGPLFELVALFPFLIVTAFGALLFIEMRASLEGAF